MPMAFGSLLGGTITMIGTPPNIIIADIREEALGASFGIFDFTPVGLSLAAIGLAFMWLTSHWLVPTTNSRDSANSPYDMSSYLTELWVPEGAGFVGKTLYELETKVKENFAVVAVKQGKTITNAPPRYYRIKTEDVLIVEADTETLQQII